MAGKYDIEIQQGADFDLSLGYNSGNKNNYTPIDITDYSARLQIVPRNSNQSAIVWSTDNNLITIPNPANGKFVIAVPADQTANYDFINGDYEFEIISPTNKIKRLLKGLVMLTRELLDE